MTAQPEPFRPDTFTVFPVGTAKTTRRGGKTVRCWDVRGRVDGQAFFRRFTAPEGTAEQAKKYARDLARDFETTDLLWDPTAKRFVEPVPEVIEVATVWTWALEYWELQVAGWEPATRAWAARSLTRAVKGLLRDKAGDPPATVDALLAATFTPTPVSGGHVPARSWLNEWSMPLAEVTHSHLESLLAAHRRKADGTQVAPATEKRFAADLRQCWQQAVARSVIDRDPWPAVRVSRKTKRNGTVTKATKGVTTVDKDIVLSPEQVWALADALGAQSKTAARYRAFIALMGLCGLRPSEACAVTVGDLELPDADDEVQTGWVTVRRTQRVVAAKWVADDEDDDYGPLKGRGSDEDRRAPIPSKLVAVLRAHLADYRAGAGEEDLAFTTVTGKPIDLSRFSRDHWLTARDAMFGKHKVLKSLRRHDLRHAACSMWLAAGVPVKVATQWSGHKTVSVFLDIYQGVLPGSEDQGVAAVETYLS